MLSPLCLAVLFAAPQDPAPTTPASTQQQWAADRDQRMAWWREARFGMFVHWGLYSGAGGQWDGKVYPQHYAEWIQNWAKVPCAEYAAKMKPLFRPEPDFATAWADLAAEAGMRYAVMTAKHHDGFTLFRSQAPYSLDNPITGGTNISPEGRDVAREFAEAMRKRGLRPGFYYSLLDWQHPHAYEMALPGYPRQPQTRDHEQYKQYLRAHVDELLTGYGELGTLWFDYSDAQHQGAAWGAEELLADLRRKQPHILVNNRLYEGLENKNGDYGTPEKYVPPTGLPGMDWEVNHTLNESYGYSAHDQGWKDTTTVVQLLCDIVSKGGNLLLNIGPDANGRVPAPAQQVLRGVGAWMKTNGEAIYGTTASPFGKLPWGRATRRGDALYLMVFAWPTDGVLHVPLRNRVRAARLLGNDAAVTWTVDEASGGLVLTVRKEAVDPACSVIRLLADGAPDALPFAVRADAAGAFLLSPSDAELHGPSLRIERVGAVGDVTYNLGYWLDPAAFASWPIVTAKARTYRVVAELACKDEAAGASIRLVCGTQELTHTVVGTGGWQSYRDFEFGTVQLAAGTGELALRALTKPGEAVVNVRGLRLLPQ